MSGWILGLTGLALCFASLAATAPRAVCPQDSFDFGEVVRGEVVEHEFVVKNSGSAPLLIDKVRMTPPLTVTEMPSRIMPGAEAPFRFRLDTSEVKAVYEGLIWVSLNDPQAPEIELRFEGKVVGTVEVAPMPVFIVSSGRGEEKEASLEIISHEPEPLHIRAVEHSQERFTTSLAPIEKGRRYRLSLRLKTDGPPGRKSHPIVVRTSSKTSPVVRIAAYTYVHERVYTFPEAIDLGTVPLPQIRKTPRLIRQLAQTLMVYQTSGSKFEATFRTDLPGLDLRSERGPKGDRYQTTVTLIPHKLQPGPVAGSIVIETNDPEFSRLTVPVSGRILD